MRWSKGNWGGAVFWPALPGVEPLPCEVAGKGRVPTSWPYSPEISFSSLEWNGMKNAGLFLPMKYGNPCFAARGERDLSFWPHLPGVELPLNSAGAGEEGNGS